MILPIALTSAAAAALINIWLAARVIRVRLSAKVLIGDGGNEQLIASGRAHSNFVEYTPFVLILIALVELALGSAMWLWVVSGVFLIGRVFHGLGMGGWRLGREIGIGITMLTLIGLAGAALSIPYLTVAKPAVPAGITHSAG